MTFSRLCPGSPAEIAVRAAATIAVSRGPKAPRWNNPPAIACDSTAKAIAAGNDNASAISSVRDCRVHTVLTAYARRDGGTQHRCNRNRYDAKRQLIQAVGIVKPRYRRLRRRRHHDTRHQLELRNAARKDSRNG